MKGYPLSPQEVLTGRVEARNVATSSPLQVLGEVGIAQLRLGAAEVMVKDGVAETNVGPAIPTDEIAFKEVTEVVLNTVSVILPGNTEAMGTVAVLMINNKRLCTVNDDIITRVILAVARRGNPDDFISAFAREDNDVLPIVDMTIVTLVGVDDGLVLLEIVLVPAFENLVISEEVCVERRLR